jgi:hypothetical protein
MDDDLKKRLLALKPGPERYEELAASSIWTADREKLVTARLKALPNSITGRLQKARKMFGPTEGAGGACTVVEIKYARDVFSREFYLLTVSWLPMLACVSVDDFVCLSQSITDDIARKLVNVGRKAVVTACLQFIRFNPDMSAESHVGCVLKILR